MYKESAGHYNILIRNFVFISMTIFYVASVLGADTVTTSHVESGFVRRGNLAILM